MAGAYERSEHEKKYDRQMRLWGSHGQMRLETAHICVIGSGATASESLKNLVLPNVGRFTLIDDHVTTAADKASNFFVDLHSIGRPRAEVVRELMLEMNAEVKGDAVVKNARTLLAEKDLSYFSQFSLVLVADPTLSVASILPLAAFLYAANIPLVVVQCKGLLGSARLQVREHCITESHPGNDRFDLYLHPEQTKLWPELDAYIKSFKVYRDAPAPLPDGEEHAHIPYVSILGQAISRWAAEHGGQVPKTYDEKQAFKAAVRALAWDAEESNFPEAVEFAHRAYEMPKPDRFVQAVFDDAATTDEAQLKASPFWCSVRAVKDFVASEGKGIAFPASIVLPDMHCKTAYYVALKQLFAERAEKDFAAVKAHLHALLKKLGLKEDFVAESDLRTFVRNVRTIRVIRTRPLAEEYGSDGTSSAASGGKFASDLVREIIEEEVYEEEDESGAAPARKPHNPKNVHWYLALRAADMFHAKHGRVAGAAAKSVSELESDCKELIELERSLLTNAGLTDAVPEPDVAVLSEVVRSGACEPHVTGAFMGGIAAQIVLKVLLKQYVPLNNTVIWNGLFASSATFAM